MVLYKGMKVMLTKNLNKPGDYVNGMTGVVDSVSQISKNGVIVLTKTNKYVAVYPYTDPGTWIRYYPMRPGYATTLHKVQGATLKHATFWLDVPNMEAAGYVALSRVQKDDDWRFIGHLTRHHFAPAQPW